MPPTGQGRPSARKAPTASRRKTHRAAPVPDKPVKPDLVAVTIDAANGRVVSLERVDDAGSRREISAEDIAAEAIGNTTIEHLVERAFEAGIGCVLGESEEEDAAESGSSDELSQILLQSLLERSNVRGLFEAGVVNKAIVGTLIARSAVPEPAMAH